MSNILVFKENEYVKNNTGFFQFDPDCFLHGLYHPFSFFDFSYIPRELAENDPTYKQVIPYVFFFNVKTNEFLTYERTSKGNENRLHNKRSIGFGGHVEKLNEVEKEDRTIIDYICDINENMLKELTEELCFEKNGKNIPLSNVITQSDYCGELYDPVNPVGKVHFGLVFSLEIRDTDIIIKSNEDKIKDVRFVNHSQLLQNIDQYENWSKHVINSIC